MNNKLFLVIFSFFLSITYLQAQLSKTIDVSVPGTLATSLGDEKTKVVELILVGTINDADFATIRQMSLLKVLDMSDVNIVNGTIPESAFANQKMDKIVLPISLRKIGLGAFARLTTSTLDFSQCSNLEEIDRSAFSGLVLTEVNILDFSGNSQLTKFGFYATNNGVFSDFSGHVIMPKDMKELPYASFSRFYGTVDLPSTLESIAPYAFAESKMPSLILPISLRKIGLCSFGKFTTSTLDFSQCSNLEEIDRSAFSHLILTEVNILDFSGNSQLTKFGSYATNNGVFSDFSGHVIMPKDMKELPYASFSRFYGTVDLPSTLESIAPYAFHSSSINEIIIPSSLVLIETNAFQNCTTLEQITSLNPLPPALGSNVFSGVNKTTCKLIVPEGSVALYAAATQWKDFLIEAAPKPVQKVTLHYTEDSGQTIKGDYEAVRVGEYYWMNSAFRNEVMTSPTDIASLGYEEQAYINYSWLPNYSIKKSQIDLWHWRAWMFENSDNIAERLSYFDELKGVSEQEKLANIEKYYGTYHSRIHLDWLWLNAIRSGKNSRVRLLEGDAKIYNIWTEPSVQATMQLFAMCGNATRDEIKIYLSDQYRETDNNNPVVIKNRSYMTWFDKTIHNDVAHLANGYKSQYINRYGFNLLPTGDRLNNPAVIQLKDHKTGTNVQYNGVIGDFEGLNQKAVLPMGTTYAVLHDYPEIVYTKLYHWAPIRFCRPLTDEELGYKLYINVSGYPELESYSFLSTLYQNHQNGVFEVKIEKKELEQSPSNGFYELPKGYLRGFYVQYMIEYPDDTKTLSDLLRIAQQNPFIFWDKPTADGVDVPDYLPSIRSSLSLESEPANITIYPNPVTDILYFDSPGSITELKIYSTAGKLVLSQTNVGSSVSVNQLAGGTYIMKVKLGNKSYTKKIIKK